MIPLLASLNPVFRMAAEQNDLQILGILSTLIFVAAFVAWVVVALAPSNRERWSAASRLPFDDTDEIGGGDA